ncbi:MAG: hypothetical protein PW792_11965 [Acidobacteriaceae bacterium]|nr:hypothetical protein [Acidobacteriaceae bacterium]
MKNSLHKTVASVAIASCMVLAVGCKKTADNSLNYRTAINDYYTAHPACLWSTPQKFPMQIDTSDAEKTGGFDALFNQGLLNRTTNEKKTMIVMSKQVTNYDLSDKGRAAWTADTTDPSSGNFCYGHRNVSSIDSSTPNNGDVGSTTQVGYHWAFGDAAGWAKAAGVQSAFPAVATNMAGNGAATKTLTDTSSGWKVTSPASAADGSIVE